MIQQSINQLLTIGAVGAKYFQGEFAEKANAVQEQAKQQTDISTKKIKLSNMKTFSEQVAEKKNQAISEAQDLRLKQNEINNLKFGDTIPELKDRIEFNKKYISNQLGLEKRAKVIAAREKARKSMQSQGIIQVQDKSDFDKLLDDVKAKQQWNEEARSIKGISHSTYEQNKEYLKTQENKIRKEYEK